MLVNLIDTPNCMIKLSTPIQRVPVYSLINQLLASRDGVSSSLINSSDSTNLQINELNIFQHFSVMRRTVHNVETAVHDIQQPISEQ